MNYFNFADGIVKSKYLSRETGRPVFVRLDGCDVFTEPGTLQAKRKLQTESSIVTEPCFQCTDYDDNVFFFSTASGKVWKRTSGGVYSLVHTNANGAHYNASYSDVHNVVAYCTATKFGIYDFATWNDNVGTFKYGTGTHPIIEKSRRIFIGDGNVTASYEKASLLSPTPGVATWQENAIDIYTAQQVASLADDFDTVIIGGRGKSKCQAYVWNTRAQSWTNDDAFYEKNMIYLRADNINYILAGTKVYYSDGNRVNIFNDYGITMPTTQQKTLLLNGKPYFASGKDVYTLHKESINRSVAVVKEYTAQNDIVSLGYFGDSIIISTTAGIEKEGTTLSPIVVESGIDKGIDIKLYYEDLKGATVALETRVNGMSWVSTPVIDDTTDNKIVLESGIPTAQKIRDLQVRWTITPSTQSPIIYGFTIT